MIVMIELFRNLKKSDTIFILQVKFSFLSFFGSFILFLKLFLDFFILMAVVQTLMAGMEEGEYPRVYLKVK